MEEFDKLDNFLVSSGEFVVRPQDDEKDRGSGEEERSFSCDPGGRCGNDHEDDRDDHDRDDRDDCDD